MPAVAGGGSVPAPQLPNPNALPQSGAAVQVAPKAEAAHSAQPESMPARPRRKKRSPPQQQQPRCSAKSKQGEEQGPSVPASGQLPLLGIPPIGGVCYAEFFLKMPCEGGWRQHNAALTYFREICQHGGHEALSFSNLQMAAVAAIVHPSGEDFWFVHDDQRVWSWWMMVAQMTEDSIRYVVEDGDSSRGLVACEIRRRENSYDHTRHEHCPDDHPQWRDYDFILTRNDGTAVGLHPQWLNRDIPTFKVRAAEHTIKITCDELGNADGPGRFKYYQTLGTARTLKFKPGGTWV